MKGIAQMRTYQTVGLLVVLGSLAFIAGMRVGERRSAQPAACDTGDGSCCTVPVNPAARTAPKVKIPTGSGRPCLVEFGSDECEACREMAGVLTEIAPKLMGKLDLVRVDTDLDPGEAQRWRLRMVPTQILVDAKRQEQWRHEGYLGTSDLMGKLKGAGLNTGDGGRDHD